MNFFRFLFLPAIVVVALVIAAPSANAQVDSAKTEGMPTDSLGSALLNEYAKDYDIVFKATKTALEKLGYEVNFASKKRNLMETSFKVLAEEDTFIDEMEKWGEIPYMRSPGWTVGRTKVTVNFEQLDNGKIAVKVLAQLSGYEARFTNQWHYWRSNGRIEQDAMDAIDQAVAAAETP
jgi:hypothetical protein